MGKTILAKDLVESGVPVYSAGVSDEPWGFVTESDLLFGDETIVISARGNIGMPKVPRRSPFVCTQTTIAISLADASLRKYIYYYLQSVDYAAFTSQTTIPMIRVSDVNEIEVPLRSPDERNRIVAELEKQFSRLDEAVANLKRVKANLKRYKAAVLKAAVEGRLVATETELARHRGEPYETAYEFLRRVLQDRTRSWSGKGKLRAPHEPVEAGDDLPEGWCYATWDQLSHWVTYGFTRPMPHVQTGIPIVTARHVANGRSAFRTSISLQRQPSMSYRTRIVHSLATS
jgi:type I restriction enzyme S subunit